MSAPPLILGTMYFGTTVPEATARDILDAYADAGGRVLDTANCYAFWANPTGHGGQSEAVIGRWLADRPGMRDRVEIATKVGVEPAGGGGVQGLGPSVIRREVERSRARLGTDVIDVYWAHADDRDTPLADTVVALARLVAEGAVRRLGASNYATWRLERARALAREAGAEPFTAVQLADSYVHRRPDAPDADRYHRFGAVTEETRDFMDAHDDVDLWVYSPLLRGAYDRADRPLPDSYRHPGTTDRLRVLGEVAAELGATPGQVVLAWLARPGGRVRPIAGVSSVRQMESALAGAALDLPAELRDRLDRAG
ncbi:MAG: aldo/keto reductase [Thermoleophilia bacterium]|nr:aldo/keto reductase [Thermoleophilia bacterium]